MTAADDRPVDGGWEFTHRPRRMRHAVIALAVLVLLAHLLWGLTLTDGDVGVHLGGGDQVAYVALGVIWSGLLLLLLRLRVRAGAAGVEVRGPVRTRLWPWELVVGFTFPASARWPRLELPAYEHVGLSAIQSFDGEEAVTAMRALRAVAARYKPSAADPESVADR